MAHETVKAYFFSGHESVGDNSIVEVEWTEEGILAKLCECITDYQNNEALGDMFDDDPIIRMSDTINFVSEGFVQAVEDAIDGGMVYFVRIY